MRQLIDPCSGSPAKPTAFDARRLSRKLFPKDDPAFRQVVWRHLYVDPITDYRTDAVASHFASSVSDDPMLIVEHHTEATVR